MGLLFPRWEDALQEQGNTVNEGGSQWETPDFVIQCDVLFIHTTTWPVEDHMTLLYFPSGKEKDTPTLTHTQ